MQYIIHCLVCAILIIYITHVHQLLIQHCEADKIGTLVYAEVFSSSLIRPKHQFAENQTPELFDDQVNYAEVNHNLISATQNADNSEIGKYANFYIIH